MMGKRRLLEADSPIATIRAQIERPQMLHPLRSRNSSGSSLFAMGTPRL